MGCLSDKSNIEDFNKSSIPDSIESVTKSIAKINYQDKMSIGFLIKFFKDDKEFFCLMTGGEEIMSSDMINHKEDIKFFYDNESKIKKITLNSEKRLIKNFKDIGINSTVIEILPEDEIENDYFLSPVINYINNFNELKNEDIFIIQFPKGKMTYSTGKIKNINKYDFTHTTKIENELEGNPIFLKGSKKVIGIQKNSKNEANFIGPIFNYFQNFKEKNIRDEKNSDKKGEDGIIRNEKGNYYIGENKDGKREGKGKMYYKNGDLMYEGDFINDKMEGNGKYIYEDGIYYIGQFKNTKKTGKGKFYNKNGDLMYEGDFIDDKIEGNGKCIYENGNYYIGQFKEGKRHGKGKMYYKNGELSYEGDYTNDIEEGNGKYIFEDGSYYIGQVKNELAHGKGTSYYKNGNIKYEGDFVNGIIEGSGKYIYDNGNYYIGQFKKGKRHGKGIQYYKNGQLMIEANWIDDYPEGDGKFINEEGWTYIVPFKKGLMHGKGKIYDNNGKLVYEGDFVDDAINDI